MLLKVLLGSFHYYNFKLQKYCQCNVKTVREFFCRVCICVDNINLFYRDHLLMFKPRNRFGILFFLANSATVHSTRMSSFVFFVLLTDNK